jgi:hypothetical protein
MAQKRPTQTPTRREAIEKLRDAGVIDKLKKAGLIPENETIEGLLKQASAIDRQSSSDETALKYVICGSKGCLIK